MPIVFPECGSGPCTGLTGAALFVCEVANGHACCIDVSQVTTIPGNSLGPMRSGIDQRFMNDTDRRSGICHSDYVGNGARLAYVPLLQPPGNGQATVRIFGFARMFLTDQPAGNVSLRVEFVAGETPSRRSSWGEAKNAYRWTREGLTP